MPFSKDNEWKPFLKQEWFLTLPDTVKEAAYLGGNGSAKSETLLMFAIVRGWYNNPKFKQLFLRRTYPELRNEIVPRSKEIFPKFGATFNKTEMCWTFKREDQFGSGAINDGGLLFLGQCEHEEDVKQYDSMQINLFTPDEVTSLTEYIYLYIALTRVRTSDPSLPAITRAAGMPGGVGHGFIKKRFIDVDPFHERKIIVGRGGHKRSHVFATLVDNPHIDPNYRGSLEALPTEAERNARLHGSFDAYVGQVFDEFREKQYPDEPSDALHVIEPFDIPEYWPKVLVIDWGYAAYTWAGYGAISPNKRLYVYREQYWLKTKIGVWAPFIKEYTDAESPRVIRVCRSAAQDRGQDTTIEEQINTALDCVVELSNNNPGARIAGKQLLHEYLRWKPKHVPLSERKVYNEEHALWLLRNRPELEYKAYLQSFNEEEPETIPKLQIFNTCKFLITAIKSCSYAKPREGIPAEDVAPFLGDDAYDGIRIMCDTAERYMEEAVDEFTKFQIREELVANLKNTNDQTSYYRNIRKLEAVDSSQAIRMFHRNNHELLR